METIKKHSDTEIEVSNPLVVSLVDLKLELEKAITEKEEQEQHLEKTRQANKNSEDSIQSEIDDKTEKISRLRDRINKATELGVVESVE